MKLKLIAAALAAACMLTVTGVALHAQSDSTTTAPDASAPAAGAPAPGGPQGGGGWGHRGGGDRMKMMTKELDLTADQQAKIKPIMDDSRKQMMALHDDTTLTDDQKRAKMMDIMKASMTKMNAILTPAQQTKMKDLQAKRRAEMQQRMQQMQQNQGGDDSAPAQGTAQ